MSVFFHGCNFSLLITYTSFLLLRENHLGVTAPDLKLYCGIYTSDNLLFPLTLLVGFKLLFPTITSVLELFKHDE